MTMTRKSKARLARDGVTLAQATTPPLGKRTPRPTITRAEKHGYSELRFADMTSIMLDAEQGKVERWADLTRRMMKTDTDLLGVVHSRLDAVVSARWELSPPEQVSTADQQAAALAVDLCTKALHGIPRLKQRFRDLLDAIGMGFASCEIVWERRQGLWMPVDLIPIHPRRFAFSESFELVLHEDELSRHLEGERVYTRQGRGIRLPANKYIIHQPSQILDYPTSSGLFFTTARYWWVKQWVLKYWLNGAEVAGNPRHLGKYPQNATSEVKEELFEALEALAADGIGVMADETSVEILAPLANGSTSVWQTLLEKMDQGYAKAWLGSTLNTDVGDSGSRALGESQAETTIDPRRDRDGDALWETICDQLLRPFLCFNSLEATGPFAGRMPPVPRGRFVFAEEVVEVDQLIVDAGGVEVDELRESRGLVPWGGERGKRVVQPLRPDAMPVVREPEAQPDAPQGVEPTAQQDVQSAALNGAQVTSLLEIVNQVVSGMLPRQSAIEIIISAFPIDRTQAERILGDVGQGFVPTPAEVADVPLARRLARLST